MALITSGESWRRRREGNGEVGTARAATARRWRRRRWRRRARRRRRKYTHTLESCSHHQHAFPAVLSRCPTAAAAAAAAAAGPHQAPPPSLSKIPLQPNVSGSSHQHIMDTRRSCTLAAATAAAPAQPGLPAAAAAAAAAHSPPPASMWAGHIVTCSPSISPASDCGHSHQRSATSVHHHRPATSVQPAAFRQRRGNHKQTGGALAERRSAILCCRGNATEEPGGRAPKCAASKIQGGGDQERREPSYAPCKVSAASVAPSRRWRPPPTPRSNQTTTPPVGNTPQGALPVKLLHELLWQIRAIRLGGGGTRSSVMWHGLSANRLVGSCL